MSSRPDAWTLERVFLLIIKGGIFILPLIALVISSSLYFPFISGKNFIFRIVVEIIGALWISVAILNQEYRPRRTMIFWALFALIAIASLSTVFSADPYRSFWSNFERMEGLITYLHLFLLFLVLSSVMKKDRDWTVLFFVSLATSVIVSFYGLLEKTGAISSLTGGGRIFSTLGNSIYLAIYLLFHLFFICWALLKSKKLWLKIILGVAFILDTIVLLFSQTRGALVGFGAGFLIMLLLFILFNKSKKIKIAAGILIAVSLFSAFMIYKYHDVLIAKNIPGISTLASISFSEPTAVSRVMIWKIGLSAVKDRPLLGWGLENFQIPYAEHYIPSLFGNEPWFDRTHNVVLDWFVSAGILGGLAYLALFAIIFWTLVKLWRAGKLTKNEGILAIGLVVSYLIQNLFVFDNITSHLIFISFLGYVASRENTGTLSSLRVKIGNSTKEIIAPATAIIFGLVLAVWINAKPISVAYNLINTMSTTSEGVNFSDVLGKFKSVLSEGTFGQREGREQLTNLTNTVVTTKTSLKPEEILELMNLTISEMKKEVAAHFSPKHHIFLARLLEQYYSLTGNGYKEALDEYKNAVSLAPDYVPVKIGLIELYLARGDKENASSILADLERYKAKSWAFWKTIMMAYVFMGDEQGVRKSLININELGVAIQNDEIETIGKLALSRKLPAIATFLYETSYRASKSVSSTLSLAEIYADSGSYDKALDFAHEALALDHSLKDEVSKFEASIEDARGKK